MLNDAFDSLGDIFSAPFRRVMAKSLALTTAALVAAWFALDALALSFVHVGAHLLATTISVVVGLGLFAGLIFMAAPVASLVAGFFFDEIAAHVESEVDPTGTPGRAAPPVVATLAALRFAGLSFAVNVVALILIFAAGFGVVVWVAANAYLLGREYFELAAMRFRPAEEARAMRRRFALSVFARGLMIAVFVAVPVLNLLTPLFATTLMARLHKRLSRAA